MRTITLFAFVLITVFAAFALPASAQEATALKDWSIIMENTSRYETYDFYGNPAGSPYQDTGGQYYDEMNAAFSRQLSPYESFSGRFDVLYNDSRYRSRHNGLVLERGTLAWEKGDTALPFRAQLGDNFSFISLRTMQRSLKGFQLEFQPEVSQRRKQSFLFFTGTGVDDYRDFTPINNLFSGGSYLIEDSIFGHYSLNLVQNHQASEIVDGLGTRNQLVTSMTGEKVFSFSGQKVTLEGEAGYFSGDYDISATEARTGKSGLGFFGQVTGETGTPFTYRLRYEDYGEDYKPNGAIVNRDYRASEAHAAWRFQKGLNLRGRLQRFTDGVNSGNPTDTSVAGLSLTGPMAITFLLGLTTGLDAFIQDVKNRDRTTNARTTSLNMNFSMPVRTWAAKLALIGRHIENFTEAVNWQEQRSYEANVSATRAIAFAGFKGSITPGVIYQNMGGNGTDRDNYGANLALQLLRAAHQFGFDCRVFSQNVYVPGTSNDMNNSAAVNYRFTMGPHVLGLELNYYDRDPTPGRVTGRSATQAYKAAVFYTLKFEKEAGKPLSSAFRRLVEAPAATDARTAPAPQRGMLASPFAIGRPLKDTMEGLAAQGITGGVAQPGLVVYEARLLPEIDQRQRLGLVHDDKTVTKVALVIDFDDVGNPETVRQTFERVRSILLKRFGAPLDTVEQGKFGPTFARDVNNGSFVRITEWRTDKGTVRFGIPQRLDRQIRMELQHAPAFPSRTDTFWSVEEIM